MSEDEGSVDASVDGEAVDDSTPTGGDESEDEQGAPRGEATTEANTEDNGEDEVDDDGFVTADPEAVDDAAADENARSVDADAEDGSPVSEDIVDRVAAYDEDAAAEVRALVERAFELKVEAERIPELEDRVDDLEETVEELRDEREELRSKLRRNQADFKNYKERQKRKQEQLKERATEDLVERLVGVRDNLKRALDQDVDDDESIRGGVEMTLKEFDRVLEAENVEEIAPDVGEDVDPQRHEVMVRVDSDLPEGAIAELYNPGYEMADRVIQAAQVTVSNGANYDPDGADDSGGEDAAAGGDEDAADDADEDADDEAVALGGEVDDGTTSRDAAAGEASDEDISAALDDE